MIARIACALTLLRTQSSQSVAASMLGMGPEEAKTSARKRSALQQRGVGGWDRKAPCRRLWRLPELRRRSERPAVMDGRRRLRHAIPSERGGMKREESRKTVSRFLGVEHYRSGISTEDEKIVRCGQAPQPSQNTVSLRYSTMRVGHISTF